MGGFDGFEMNKGLKGLEGRVVKLHDCNLDEGRCFAYCPRIEVNPKINDEEIDMGPVRRILMARAREPLWRERAQAGGVVSALIDFALRRNVIDAAVLTQRGTDSLPQGRIVRNRGDILACAGSGAVFR